MTSSTIVMQALGDDAVPPLPAPESTVLDRIKAQLAAEREKAAASVTFLLPVPRHPSVVIEFTALTQAVWQAVQEEGQKNEAKPVDTQARLLMEACTGIFIEFDGQMFPASEALGGRAPSFKGDLDGVGKLVGIPYGGVRNEWVKALYVTDGDLISTAAAVLDLSGFARGAEIEASVKGK